MKSIQIVTALALASLTASAFAGPDWDAINRARASAQKRHASAEAAAHQQSMSEDCAAMMEHMPANRAHESKAMAGNMAATPQQVAAMPMPTGMTGASASAGATVGRAAALFGEPARETGVIRTVSVSPGMKAVPVEAGETVRFNFGPTSAAWTFAARPGFAAVDLGLLFPDVPAARGVWAYPNGSRLYQGH